MTQKFPLLAKWKKVNEIKQAGVRECSEPGEYYNKIPSTISRNSVKLRPAGTSDYKTAFVSLSLNPGIGELIMR